MRPARTLVGALAERADRWPEAAFGLSQILGAGPIAAQIVVAPAEKTRPVAAFDVMAIGLDDGRRRRLKGGRARNSQWRAEKRAASTAQRRKTGGQMKMSAEAVAHSVRWLIWAFSAVAVGAMKPLLFPEGGAVYAMAALFLLLVLALLGLVVERWLIARIAPRIK